MNLVGVVTFAFLVVMAVLALFVLLKQFLYIGTPNQVLIFSGRDHVTNSGQKVGYRYTIGGLTIRVPIFEQVDRMDLRVMPVNIHIDGAYSKGGIPLNVHAIANVKISSDPGKIHNAIERFLGRDRSEITRVAKETLEGNLRGVLATLTPEELNENRLRFVEELTKDVAPDFSTLGLHLDTLKIQNISDEKDYLDSIGRKRIAEIIKRAEVAESNATKSAEETEAEEQGRSEVARRKAQAQIQKAQNELREIVADLERDAKSAEEKAQARALAARAEAEQDLQRVRTDLEVIRLQADVVIPAQADKSAREFIAAGEAARIAENGRAMAEVLRMMSEVWVEAGDAAMDVFIMQRMEQIMKQVAEAARQVKVREVALIDGGDGSTLPSYVSSFPRIVGSIFRELRDNAGIDIATVLKGPDAELMQTLMEQAGDAGALPGQPKRKGLGYDHAGALEESMRPSAATQQVPALSSSSQASETRERQDSKPSFSSLQRRLAKTGSQPSTDGSGSPTE